MPRRHARIEHRHECTLTALQWEATILIVDDTPGTPVTRVWQVSRCRICGRRYMRLNPAASVGYSPFCSPSTMVQRPRRSWDRGAS